MKAKRPSPTAKRRILQMGILLACSSVSAFGQTVWSGKGDGTSWSDPANWSNGAPSITQQTRFVNSNLPDAPISVTVDTIAPLRALNFATTLNRTMTIGGGTLFLEADAAVPTITWNSSFAGESAVIINSNVNYSNSVADTSATFSISTGAYRPYTFNGDITTSGSGPRPMSLSIGTVVTINGSNAASYLNFGGTGELIAGSNSALGSGGVKKTGTATLSLRSDVTITGSGADHSWYQNDVTSGIRISEEAASTADRTLTMNGRITKHTSGTLEFLENVNSTGNLILALKYSGDSPQDLDLVTNDTAIVRFAQTGDTTYSNVISGSGQVQKTDGTGTTTFTQANTYTGKTTVAAGTLLLDTDGSIANSSEINLGTAGSQGTLDVTAKSSFAFGTGQTVSGYGTINIGAGKTVTLSGNVNPGNSPGQINVIGDIALETTTFTTIELAGLGGVAGTDFDNMTATGAFTYGGTLSIVSFGGFDIYQEETYSLFDFASQAGNFDLVSFGGNALSYDSGIWSGTDGSYEYSLTLATGNLAIAPIPEPSAVFLLSLGAASLLVSRRRTRSGIPS